jgi:hypothetical protein
MTPAANVRWHPEPICRAWSSTRLIVRTMVMIDGFVLWRVTAGFGKPCCRAGRWSRAGSLRQPDAHGTLVASMEEELIETFSDVLASARACRNRSIGRSDDRADCERRWYSRPQNWPVGNVSTGAYSIRNSGSFTSQTLAVAQTFTAGTSGYLSDAALNLFAFCGTTSCDGITVSVQIRSVDTSTGQPNLTLAQADFPESQLPAGTTNGPARPFVVAFASAP